MKGYSKVTIVKKKTWSGTKKKIGKRSKGLGEKKGREA